MRTLTLANIKFEIEVSVKSPVGVLHIIKSAECLETGVVYSKEKANEYYRLYS